MERCWGGGSRGRGVSRGDGHELYLIVRGTRTTWYVPVGLAGTSSTCGHVLFCGERNLDTLKCQVKSSCWDRWVLVGMGTVETVVL